MVSVPVAAPSEPQRASATQLVAQLVAATRENQAQRVGVLDLLRMEYGVTKAGNALGDMQSLTSDAFVDEVRKRRPKPGKGEYKGLSPLALKQLRRLFDEEVAPLQERRAAMRIDERALAKVVHQAYGLTPAEEKLLWQTAPPRMPDAR